MEAWFEIVFGGDTAPPSLTLPQVAARAVLVFMIGVAIVRVGKSRLVGGMTSLDVIVGFILGSLLSRGITGEASLSGTTVASAAVVASHWVLTWITFRSQRAGFLLKGRSALLVRDGEPLHDNLRRSHISENELQEAMRRAGVNDLREVREAYRERNGEISVLRKD